MDFLVHLLLPHPSNNHRPKVLHNASLLLLVLILLALSLLLPFIRMRAPTVLGLATEITIEGLVGLTNAEREKNGLPSLNFDSQLSLAAQEKAKDMLVNNYWAHNGPNGKSPWIFVIDSGYQYAYAGENLARDFSSSEDVVRAWIASPAHRANILSSNYQDIGFAVVQGKLDGRETTLIVQLLGTRKEVGDGETVRLQVFGAEQPPFINSWFLSRNMTVSILGFLLFVLAIDMIIAYRKKLIRLAGHNLDHIIFLGSLALVIIMERRGLIL